MEQRFEDNPQNYLSFLINSVGTAIRSAVSNTLTTIMTLANGLVTVAGTLKAIGHIDISTGGLDNNGSVIMGSDYNATTRTNSVIKAGVIVSPHYLAAEENVTALLITNTDTSNNVELGGGCSNQNAATKILFLTAANYNTTSGTVRMSIASDGKVKIGTGSASEALDVTGNIKASGTLNVLGSIEGTTAKLTNLTDGYIPYRESDAVGLADSIISVTTSASILNKADTTTACYNGFITGANLDGLIGIEDATGGGLFGSTLPNAMAIGTITNTSITFHTNNVTVPRLTILNNGKIGVGNIAPSEALDVTGNIKASGSVQAGNDTTAANTATKVGAIRYRATSNDSYVDVYMQTGAATYDWQNILHKTW